MKTIACTALHYGTDYLAYAIRSIIDHVDQYWVLYVAQGSHGSRTEVPCPDTRESLMKIAYEAAGSKLVWVDGDWTHEGQQRDTIYSLVPDADMILTLDADEIWSGYDLNYLYRSPIRRWRLPMIHYWRSFHRAIVHDPAYPVRVVCPKYPESESTTHIGLINHFGYAQRSEVVQYKQLTHGHRGEWRHDVDWFKDRFVANAQEDCHPVGSQYWNPEPVNPLDYLPVFMEDHPYFSMEVIP